MDELLAVAVEGGLEQLALEEGESLELAMAVWLALKAVLLEQVCVAAAPVLFLVYLSHP